MTPRFTVGTFLRTSPQHYPSFEKADYRQAYFELSEVIKEHGGQLFLAADQSSYLGNGRFAKGWLITKLGEYQEIQSPVASVIFNKGNFVSDGKVPVLNHRELSEICTDKFLMYELFSEFCPKTFLAKTQAEFLTALEQITTPLAVVKPLEGYEGNDVFIEPAAQLAEKKLVFPVIVQEFIDTSAGIPGIIDGHHDLRVTLLNDEVAFSWVRTPPPGKLTANVAQGGIFKMVPLEKIPPAVLDIVRKIDAHMARFGTRFYCIDFGISPDGPRLIEMNAQVGIFPDKDAQEFIDLKHKLAQTFETLSKTTA